VIKHLFLPRSRPSPGRRYSCQSDFGKVPSMRIVPILLLTPFLASCTLARTAVGVATVPVKVVSARRSICHDQPVRSRREARAQAPQAGRTLWQAWAQLSQGRQALHQGGRKRLRKAGSDPRGNGRYPRSAARSGPL